MINAARRRGGKKPTGERLQSEKVQYRLFCHAHGDRLINGTEGDLQLTAAGGQARIFEMAVRGGRLRRLRSRSCPCQTGIGGRRRKARALPPTSPNRMRLSPATIAKELISAPHSTTRSRVTAY
jgi:hypothetical protein